MEGVTSLVQHRADVVVDAHRVHEDERHPPEVETRRIATRGFGFPVFEVEQSSVGHRVHVAPEIDVDVAQHSGAATDELVGGRERSQLRSALGVHCGIPRA